MGEIAERIKDIRARIDAAAKRAGRDPATVRLMGVTKTVPVERVAEAYAAGLTLFGENYVQEGLAKVAALPGAEFHFIGHLQSNKAKKAAESFELIQSLDRPSLAVELSKAAVALGKVLPVLIEVNLGDEDTKSGCTSEEAVKLACRAGEWPGLKVAGLMALPPWSDDPEATRPHFRALAELARRIESLGLAGIEMRELSMGMSGDFEAAIEEGATIVRVGTALFGERRYNG